MLGAIFGASVRLRNALYDSGRLHSRRLAGPVVSVGNISVGGAGKTPFVIALGELLQHRGIAFDVLSRGYRRATKGVLEVDPSGSPEQFGDEPLLIARRLNVPVIVGESRLEAGQWCERTYGPRLHLLDDGFQHRRLARDFDIVLVTAQDVRDRLLPEGRLREPLTAIRRADVVVIPDDGTGSERGTGECGTGCPQPVPSQNVVDPAALPLHPGQLLWRIRRGIAIDPPCPSSDPLLAFCALARPRRFFDDLRSAGLTPAADLPFRDHHRYTASDIDKLLASAQAVRATGFITTEKDLINLGPLPARLHPLYIARVTLDLLDAHSCLDQLLARIEK